MARSSHQAVQQLRRMKLEEGIEEKEALTQDDFENLVMDMDEEVEERDIPIERLRNLDLIVFDNSIRYVKMITSILINQLSILYNKPYFR